MSKTAQNQALDDAIKSIEKQFGKWSIMKMWDNSNFGQVNVFHSGSYILDLVLGWWYPEGRVIELYWPESSGKTTIALQAIASIQAKWEIAAFIDAEHALDPVYAKTLGVDTKNLLISQPNDWEQALQIAEELAKSGVVKLIVIDSVAALVPRAEVEWDMWDSFMWLQARMMSQWLRKLTSILGKTWTTCIFINQIRMKIWIMFWNPETTSGGQALKFFSSQRIEIRKSDMIKEDKDDVGYYAKITIKKNKIFPPFKVCMVPIKWSMWIEKTLDMIEAGVLLGLISRAGAFYSIWDQKVQGKEKLEDMLKSEKNISDKLQKDIQSKIKAMRTGEKVIDEEAFEKIDININEE